MSPTAYGELIKLYFDFNQSNERCDVLFIGFPQYFLDIFYSITYLLLEVEVLNSLGDFFHCEIMLLYKGNETYLQRNSLFFPSDLS